VYKVLEILYNKTMKKYKKSIIIVAIIVICVSLIAICGCNKIGEEAKFYKVTYLSGEGGYIDGQAEQTVESGKDGLTIVAVPDEGYRFVEWSDGVDTAERTDKNITTDLSVKALFEKVSCTVNYETDGNGTISGKSTQKIDINADGETVTAIPNKGYKFVAWSDGIDTAERTDKNITRDLSVKALFKKISCTINYETDGNGRIEGNENQTIKYGETATIITAIPNIGYRFVKWSDGLTEATRQDRNVTKDIVVKAIFEKQTFTLTYVAGDGGYLVGNLSQTVTYGESGGTVTAIPNDGYRFVKWSDLTETPERQDINVTADKTVTAIFEKQTFTLTYVAGVGGTIDGQSEQEIGYGEDAVFVVAVPQAGYKFVKWSDGNGSTIRRETNVVSEISVTAEFEFLYEGGEGTLLKPFTIANYTQLNDMWYYPESNYKLINDLDLSGISHEPIFDDAIYFSGRFNGGGHTIHNLTVDTDLNYPSLFGVISGIVSDLNFVNANIKTCDFNTQRAGQKYCVGIVAGKSAGLINKVKVSGKITVDGITYDGVAVGGIAGMVGNNVLDCSTDIQMTVKNVKRENETNLSQPFLFGGLFGFCNSANVINCETQGEINIIDSSYDIYVGGLIGYYFNGSQADKEIKDSITNITIKDENGSIKAGGFIGYLLLNQNTSLQITNSSVYGNITSGKAGGFIYEGYSSFSNLLIENCIVENEIHHAREAAGFINLYSGQNCIIRDCHATCVMETTRLPQTGGSAGWGFAYSVSRINFNNCYSSGSVYAARGGGFGWMLSHCIVEQCYSDNDIYSYYSSSAFVTALLHSEIINCYSQNNYINEPKYDENVPLSVIRILRNSKIRNFYYSGNLIERVFKEVTNSEITNFHCLKSEKLTDELIEVDRGDVPSLIDIAVYENPEDMYYLAEKLNDSLIEDVWINQENDFPILII
jgi:hypothetical protein